MMKAFCITVLLISLASTPIASHRRYNAQTVSYSNKYLKRQEAALVSWGYEVKKRDEVAPTEWEKETFNTQQKRRVFVKSRKAVSGEAHTYYRFTLIEEIYADEAQAKYRLENLFEKKPPRFVESERYEFGLRRGYQRGNAVYTLGTDAVLFEKEMERLAKRLQEVVKRN
jgi:hypothetical protein